MQSEILKNVWGQTLATHGSILSGKIFDQSSARVSAV